MWFLKYFIFHFRLMMLFWKLIEKLKESRKALEKASFCLNEWSERRWDFSTIPPQQQRGLSSALVSLNTFYQFSWSQRWHIFRWIHDFPFIKLFIEILDLIHYVSLNLIVSEGFLINKAFYSFVGWQDCAWMTTFWGYLSVELGSYDSIKSA